MEDNKKTIVVAVDTGNRCIKTAHTSPFNAGLISHGSLPPPISVDTIEYDGKYYSLTESREGYRYDKTEDNYYFLLTLAGIAKELTVKLGKKPKFNETVALAIGIPPSHFGGLKEKYKKYFSNNGDNISYKYNNVQFNISVSNVFVYPQGYTAILPSNIYAKVSSKIRLYVIDIGGYTTDVIAVIRGLPDMSFCESLDMGVIHMYNLIQKRVAESCRVDIDGIMIEAVLKGEDIPREDVAAVVKDTAIEYAKNIIRTLEDKKVDMALSYLVFIGGGAILMRDSILKATERDDSLFISDVRANAQGYESCALKALRDKGIYNIV